MNTTLHTIAMILVLALVLVVGFIFIAMIGWLSLVILVPVVAALAPLLMDEIKYKNGLTH